MKTPHEIVDLMLSNDAYSNWLGIQKVHLEKGQCTLSCIVREEMLNGFGIAHGGITYALSDSALAFAANSYGLKCVSIETSISHTKKVSVNDVLTAKASEINRGRKIGIYEVHVKNQKDELVAFFKGIVNISSDSW